MTIYAEMSQWFVGLQRHILDHEAFAPLLDVFPKPPEYFHRLSDARKMHTDVRTACVGSRNTAVRDLIIAAIDSYQTQVLGVPRTSNYHSGTSELWASEMADKGHVALPPVPSKVVAEILSYFQSELLVSGDDEQAKGCLTLEEARQTRNVAQYPVKRILECPHMMEIVNDPDTLAVVERYLGATPTLLTPAAWWSFAGRDQSEDAQLYHLDIDDYRFCKLFVYLTDVDLESGPHAYLEKTHRWSLVTGLQPKSTLNVPEFFEWYYRQLRKTDAEVEKYLGISPTYMTGPAGSRFLIDTVGVHKGTLPKNRDRLICQFMYGVTPMTQMKLRPISVSSNGSGSIPSFTVNESPNDYLNRLFLTPSKNDRETDQGAVKKSPGVREKKYLEQKGPESPPGSETPAMTEGTVQPETIILSTHDDWESIAARDLMLDSILTDDWVKTFFKEQVFPRSDIIDIKKTEMLSSLIRTVCQQNIGFDKPTLNLKLAEALKDLAEFEDRIMKSVNQYNSKEKPNPQAVYWPDPTKKTSNENVFDTLPYVERLGLLNKETPIGSAGSSFALDIAKSLLARAFNYVHTEKCSNPETGVYVAEKDPNKPEVTFSANWGLLFNTASFRQIAEKSFGVRSLPRILIRLNDWEYMDPYRESVFFPSIDSYEADYDNHISASRDALLSCEYFIITLGLNECWEFVPDGSIISHNPWNSDLTGFVRHRTLSVQENVDNIQAFYDIVRAHNPEFKLLISISPVPSRLTGRADKYHVITANHHSKSVLRVAAHELVERNPHMYYFPSFETVTVCTRDPWAEDRRHVSEEGVERVMELFETMFVA